MHRPLHRVGHLVPNYTGSKAKEINVMSPLTGFKILGPMKGGLSVGCRLEILHSHWNSVLLAWSPCDSIVTPLTRAPREGQSPSFCILLSWQTLSRSIRQLQPSIFRRFKKVQRKTFWWHISAMKINHTHCCVAIVFQFLFSNLVIQIRPWQLKGWSTANAQPVETITDQMHNHFECPLRLTLYDVF